MSKNANIQSQLETVERIFEAAHTTVNDMKDGERMQIKHLAEVVGLVLAVPPKEVLAFVNSFAHHTDIAFVTRGKNGGIIRGQKVAKPAKKTKKSDTSTSV